MQMLVASWDAVWTKTVLNCFRKSKILSESQKAAKAEEDYPFKEEDIENQRLVQPDLVSGNMDAASFTDGDAENLAVQPPPSDTEIVAKLLEMEDVSNDNKNAVKTDDDPVNCPDRNELLQIIDTMQRISLFSKDDVIVPS